MASGDLIKAEKELVSSVALEDKASDMPEDEGTKSLVEVVSAMGYPETEARHALKRASNNVERAIQFLVEGAGDDDDDEEADVVMRLQRRRWYQQLRLNLLQNPADCDYAISQLYSQNPALSQHIVNTEQGVLANLLADSSSSSEEEEDAEVDD
ncbi:uncharacterized protein LOC115627522 [Scaptodrosophila lebanonensis]|uniref:Uncharacterized protein LOC115627522 n=1 Tax=Drosophila lebanonensis TaxID=7225 RepID=A0A6J2TW03_DROLE|nr:uncharacterized protein LOC115627522 [Scaptodrosophila lebanonensis]